MRHGAAAGRAVVERRFGQIGRYRTVVIAWPTLIIPRCCRKAVNHEADQRHSEQRLQHASEWRSSRTAARLNRGLMALLCGYGTGSYSVDFYLLDSARGPC
ncbi:hypothetical protein BS50DRAFT_81532 [Corynespora cassiicola Philippines]|uniref:Uncharacterized protein n=1 Tax=Corynespora cassiicola Philippines TaxID=1448308 RepID=A0A2T2NH70_CORCC|nr:hypothetical protein BS50DRAFT_81532 [Corynespora cassiicola Philippines]